eukprot:COSAG06_NODE_42685_length_379_cov_1.021429_1_plen_90_part_10
MRPRRARVLVEISAPMSQGFSFMRQKRAFLPDMQFSFTYTINPDFAKDCFVTQFLPATVSPIVNGHADTTGACKLLPAVLPASAAPTVEI